MKYYPTYLQSLGLLVIMFLCGILGGLAVLPFTGDIKDPLALSVIYLVSLSLTVVAGLFLRGNWRFNRGSFDLKTLLYGIALMAGIQVLIEPLSSAVPISESLKEYFSSFFTNPIAFALTAVVAAPVLEELIFRGIILDGYLKNYKPLPAILISSLLFALIHGNLAQGIGAFLLGLLFGCFYWKTNSILAVIMLHFVNNTVAILGGLTSDSEDMDKSLRQLMDNDGIYFSIYCLALALGAWAAWNLYGVFFKENSRVTPEGGNPKA